MAESESTNTMFQGAFVKNGDGDFSLKTSGGGSGVQTVKLDKDSTEALVVTSQSAQVKAQRETFSNTNMVKGPIIANQVIVELDPLPQSGYYQIDIIVGLVAWGTTGNRGINMKFTIAGKEGILLYSVPGATRQITRYIQLTAGDVMKVLAIGADPGDDVQYSASVVMLRLH